MPTIKIQLPDELADKLESDTLASGVSRHKVLEDILEAHYSSHVSTEHRDEILNEKEKQIQHLEQMLNCMYQLNYVLVGTKLLPSGAQEPLEQKKPSLWSRVRHLFRY